MNCKIQTFPSMKSNKKDTLWNLNQLLGQKVVASPQKIIQKKLFPTNLPKTNITPQLNAKLQNSHQNTHRNHLKINFQFDRSRNSYKQLRLQIFPKRSLTLNPISSIEKVKNSLKNQFLISENRTDPIHNLQILKSYKSQLFSSNKMFSQNKLNSSNSKIFYPNKYSKQQPNLLSQDQQKKAIFSCRINPENRQQSSKKKSFLKKGASLQKQIVVNLLKNKIIKQHESEIQKQYTTKEVLNMIKLYKGIYKDQGKNKQESAFMRRKIGNQGFQESQKNDICPLNVVNKLKKPIQGWQFQQQMEIE